MTVSYIKLKYEEDHRVKFYIGNCVSFSETVTVIKFDVFDEYEPKVFYGERRECNLVRKNHIRRNKK
jgi:hypothetical protein